MKLTGTRSGAVISYVYMAAQILVQLAYIPILLSVIGQAEYGLYQLIGSIMAYIVSINGVLASGVGRYYCMYRVSGDAEKMENTLAIAKRLYLLLSLCCVLAIAVIIPVFQSVYKGIFTESQLNECSLMLIVLGINAIVTMNNAINIAVITASEHFVFLKGSQLVTLIIQPVIVLLFAHLMPNALFVTLVVLAMNVLCSTGQRVYAKSVLRARYTYHGWDSCLAKSLLHFSAAIVLVTIADQVFWKTNQLIVGYFYGPELVAVYAVGAQIYSAYMSLGTSISSVYLPRVSELYHDKHDMEAISHLFAKIGRITFYLTAFVLGGFMLLGREFVYMWAGDGYEQAYFVALIVMIPFTIDLIQNLGLTILQVADKYYFRGYMYSGIAIVNLFCSFYLVGRVGLIGAAASTAISMFIGNGLCMNWYYSRKIGLDIGYFWRELKKPVIAFMITLLIAEPLQIMAFPAPNLMSFVIHGAIYSVLYAVIEWKFAFNEYEKETVKSYIHFNRKS